MLPLKRSPMQKNTIMSTARQDLLDLAERAQSQENLSLVSDDITGESMLSTCSDMGYKQPEDRYLLDSCPDFFKQMTQSMSDEQSIPPTENIFDVDNVDSTDNVGNFNLDSILCQFDTFFRGKLDSELQLFQENMHAMLTEQQIHIQRIISSSAEQHINESSPAESNLNSTKTMDIRCMCHDAESKAKMGLIMELLSLSCQLTPLLNLPKFDS